MPIHIHVLTEEEMNAEIKGYESKYGFTLEEFAKRWHADADALNDWFRERDAIRDYIHLYSYAQGRDLIPMPDPATLNFKPVEEWLNGRNNE